MAQGLNRDKCLEICEMSKNQFYYQSKGGKRGRKKSKFTLQLTDGQTVGRTNTYVKEQIRLAFENPKVDYGYHRMTGYLQLSGFFINHKKVYRLMKEARLLQPKAERETRNYVKYRVLCPESALRLMEMDIKQIWIEGERRYAYILTIIDVFTRVVLYWTVGYQMRQQQVQNAWGKIIEGYFEPLDIRAWEVDIEVRSDNGPQFCAKKLQDFLKENYLLQTFTHPYTPQENGHVESFHAILNRDMKGLYFENLFALETELEEFYPFYNFERIHGSTLKLPPVTFWNQWNLGKVERSILDEKSRKVKFTLNGPRQHIVRVKPVGNGSPREVLLLIFEGRSPKKSNLIRLMFCHNHNQTAPY